MSKSDPAPPSPTPAALQTLRDRVRELALALATTAKELGEKSAEYELGLALDSVAMKPKEAVPPAGETANGTESRRHSGDAAPTK